MSDASVPSPPGPEPERFFLFPGDRLLVYPDGAEWPLVLESAEPKPWISEERVERDKVGYEDIGRVTALRFRDAVHMLVRAGDLGGGRWRYEFKPWILHDVPRAMVNYPEDEFERRAFEENEAFQQRHSSLRRLMLPIVGGLPTFLQFWIEDTTCLNMGNASRANTLATLFPTVLLVVLYYIVGPIALAFRAVIFQELWVKWTTAYLVLDCAVRYWHTAPDFADMRMRKSDEIGYLALEIPARLAGALLGRAGLKTRRAA